MADLADRFTDAYHEALANIGAEALSRAWLSQTERTRFLGDDIIPAVAKRLGFIERPEKELLQVDFAIAKKVGSIDVPVIFIESENIAETTSREVHKLCCLSAPLKVLISVCEWSDCADEDTAT